MMTYDYAESSVVVARGTREGTQMRIGLVGTESDHAEDALRMLNRESRFPGVAVAALWGAEADRTRTRLLAHCYGVAEISAEPSGLLGKVDAVIVGARDGRLHLAHALPYLEGGLPVFIDKPFACSVADAQQLLDASAASGAPILSASALRWQAGTEKLKQTAGPIEQVIVTGSFYPDSPYGGSIFYGVHTVELALELAGAGIEDVGVTQATAEAMTITGRVGTTRVEMRMVRPAEGEGSSFRAELLARGETSGGPVSLPRDYMAPVLQRFVNMLKSGAAPMTRDELLAPVRVLEFGEAALRTALSPQGRRPRSSGSARSRPRPNR